MKIIINNSTLVFASANTKTFDIEVPAGTDIYSVTLDYALEKGKNYKIDVTFPTDLYFCKLFNSVNSAEVVTIYPPNPTKNLSVNTDGGYLRFRIEEQNRTSALTWVVKITEIVE